MSWSGLAKKSFARLDERETPGNLAGSPTGNHPDRQRRALVHLADLFMRNVSRDECFRVPLRQDVFENTSAVRRAPTSCRRVQSIPMKSDEHTLVDLLELLDVGSLKIDSSVRWGYEASSRNYPGSGFDKRPLARPVLLT
jgi:hypothetical protein